MEEEVKKIINAGRRELLYWGNKKHLKSPVKMDMVYYSFVLKAIQKTREEVFKEIDKIIIKYDTWDNALKRDIIDLKQKLNKSDK